MTQHLHPPVLWTLALIVALLAVASVVARALRRRRPDDAAGELVARIRSWWVMVAIFAGALVLGRVASIVLLALVSFLALKEYLSLIPTRRVDRRVLFWAYLAIPVQFWWVGIGWYGMFVIFVPVYMFLFLPLPMLIVGETQGYLRAVATLHWGLMTTVFSVGHAAFLLVLPEAGNPGAGGAGLLLFLLVVTELNDVAQFVSGKLLGRHRLIPKVSPKKTWEGFLGGLVVTALVAAGLGLLLPPLPAWGAAATGLLLSAAGLVGDLTVSALKRDLGIKDSGNVIPGHGGILDRLDSLTYTAPIFFHLIWYLYY